MLDGRITTRALAGLGLVLGACGSTPKERAYLPRTENEWITLRRQLRHDEL